MTTTTTTPANDDEKEPNVVLVDHVLEASFDSVFLTDRQGCIRKVNRVALEKFGYKDESSSSLVGQNISVVIGGPHAARHGHYLATLQERNDDSRNTNDTATTDATATNALESVLNRMRDVKAKKKDGTTFDVQVGLRIVPGGYLAFCHDLSHDKHQQATIAKGQEAVQTHERLNRSILDSSFDSVIVTDEMGQIVDVNELTLTVFGFDDMNQVIGTNISSLVGGGHACRHDSYMKAFRDRKGTSRLLGQQRNLSARRRDGSEFPCKIGVRKVPNSNLLVGFVRDITDEINAMTLAVEKKAAEHLLMNMLPHEIAERLKKSPEQIADHFTEAVVLFADLVGFTSMSNRLTPIQVVTFLNDIFSRFDARLDDYGLNKIKTIGDCYMVTTIPHLKDEKHMASYVCHFALDMVKELQAYNKLHPDHPLDMRIGIHTGPVVAGVVGTKRFLYDIWGDAVNLASRMESTGVPGRIQITQDVIDSTKPDEFTFERRGMVAVKGIGEMETFFLNGRNVEAEEHLELRSSRSLHRLRSQSKLFVSDILEILKSSEQLPEPVSPLRSPSQTRQLRTIPSDGEVCDNEFSNESLPEL